MWTLAFDFRGDTSTPPRRAPAHASEQPRAPFIGASTLDTRSNASVPHLASFSCWGGARPDHPINRHVLDDVPKCESDPHVQLSWSIANHYGHGSITMAMDHLPLRVPAKVRYRLRS